MHRTPAQLMTRWLSSPALVAAVFSLSACASDRPMRPAPSARHEGRPSLTREGRRAFIRRAQVWKATNVSAMNLRLGPEGKGAFPPGATVTCDYVERRLAGSSPKFECRTEDGDVVKVRYGETNGEVEGAVLATRLLWALGFGADRVYPVHVICRACSPDPWSTPQRALQSSNLFDLAAIERKPEGNEMRAQRGSGWAWSELDAIDEAEGGAPRAHRDALILLAVFMQHSDNKADQQRLVCLPHGLTDIGGCDRPFFALHDVGLTFGRGTFLNNAETSSVNFVEWARTPVWRNRRTCEGHLDMTYSGTLHNPKIAEPGRAFLADLLEQLTDAQLRDLFDVARVERRSRRPDGHGASFSATVDEWVAAFKQKRLEVVSNRCPH